MHIRCGDVTAVVATGSFLLSMFRDVSEGESHLIWIGSHLLTGENEMLGSTHVHFNGLDRRVEFGVLVCDELGIIWSGCDWVHGFTT